MNESSKTNAIRGASFVARYLAGKVIDIGCGADLVVPWAEPFDLMHGDASQIASLRQENSYDCVQSSHCLEHLPDPPHALSQWWRLVRPGGHLITVVPDEELYEQGVWPSLFNPDHRWAFTMEPGDTRRPHILDVVSLHRRLPQAVLLDVARHDSGYSYQLLGRSLRGRNLRNRARYDKAMRWMYGHRLGRLRPELRGWPLLANLGIPIDQTLGAAVAQIQVIVRKAKSN